MWANGNGANTGKIVGATHVMTVQAQCGVAVVSLPCALNGPAARHRAAVASRSVRTARHTVDAPGQLDAASITACPTTSLLDIPRCLGCSVFWQRNYAVACVTPSVIDVKQLAIVGMDLYCIRNAALSSRVQLGADTLDHPRRHGHYSYCWRSSADGFASS